MPDFLPPERAPTLLFVPKAKKKNTGHQAVSVGDRIRELRKAKGLTQRELGRLVGLSQRIVTYYESQGGSLSPELLVRFADALDVSTDILVGREKVSRRPDSGAPDDLRLWRRVKRVQELPLHDRKTVLKMIDALADRAGKRKVS